MEQDKVFRALGRLQRLAIMRAQGTVEDKVALVQLDHDFEELLANLPENRKVISRMFEIVFTQLVEHRPHGIVDTLYPFLGPLIVCGTSGDLPQINWDPYYEPQEPAKPRFVVVNN